MKMSSKYKHSLYHPHIHDFKKLGLIDKNNKRLN